jgi:hypothetical protein
MKTLIAVHPNFRLEVFMDWAEDHNSARFEISCRGLTPNLRSTIYKSNFVTGKAREFVNIGEDEALHVSSGELTPFFMDEVLPFAKQLRVEVDKDYIWAPDEDEAIEAVQDWLENYATPDFTEIIIH